MRRGRDGILLGFVTKKTLDNKLCETSVPFRVRLWSNITICMARKRTNARGIAT